MTDRNGRPREIRGAMTALVTPFRGGAVDWHCLESLVDRQMDGGIDWLVPCGTTGETPTLSSEERRKITDIVCRKAGDRCGVMVGTGSNNTPAAIAHTQAAADAGADAALVVAPYYNRPTPEGLFRHFAAIAEAVDIPIVLYNVPSRTGVRIENDVVVRLRESFPNIVAIKHATGSLDGVVELLRACSITVLSGDDALNWPLMAVGAVGTISVVANLCPSLIKSQVDAALAGDFGASGRFHRVVNEIAVEFGRLGPNPLPIKTAMAVCGLLQEEFRLPMCPLEADAGRSIRAILKRHELPDLAKVRVPERVL